ncbi:hypothetical protein RN001_005056 [Aquatica leii]|uniref:Uncharacterized protein n=1 Tax=Aquatica leii TaxID=1421715 RepID=A0AAN7Q0P3_9COLE|nr:hypothetical protein RN001_005056 [Aquatica leii]
MCDNEISNVPSTSTSSLGLDMNFIERLVQIIEDKDKELRKVRQETECKKVSANTTFSSFNVPYGEIGAQIPKFSGKEDEWLDITVWIQRINDIQIMYELSDNVIKVVRVVQQRFLGEEFLETDLGGEG